MTRRRSRRSATEGTESDWQSRVIGLAEAYRWAVVHIPDSRRVNPSMVGFPDLTLYRPVSHGTEPDTYYRELKMPGGRLTKAQHDWGERLTELGEDWAVWWLPDDWSLVEQLIMPETMQRHKAEIRQLR